MPLITKKPNPLPPHLPTLYRYTEKGEPQEWKIEVINHNDGTATIRTTYGRRNGKKQETSRHITEGKNIGRANATTAQQQAWLDAAATHKAQLDRAQYGFTPEESFIKVKYAPMSAGTYPEFKDVVDWPTAHAQPKFNGFRCLARRINGRFQLYTRGGDIFTAPEHVIEFLESTVNVTQAPEGAAFDGELYLHGATLQEISSFARRKQKRTKELIYHVYDYTHPDAQEPFAERLARIRHAIPIDPHTPATQAHTHKMDNEEKLMEFQRELIARGYEGAMLRHGTAPYKPGGTSNQLLKVKTFKDDEFQIISTRQGDGKFQGMAIHMCQVPNGPTFEVTAPGTHQQKRKAYENRQQLLGTYLQVKFAEYTADGSPFHPVALRYRNTKD